MITLPKLPHDLILAAHMERWRRLNAMRRIERTLWTIAGIAAALAAMQFVALAIRLGYL